MVGDGACGGDAYSCFDEASVRRSDAGGKSSGSGEYHYVAEQTQLRFQKCLLHDECVIKKICTKIANFLDICHSLASTPVSISRAHLSGRWQTLRNSTQNVYQCLPMFTMFTYG